MKNLYGNMFMGFGLTGILTLSGIFVTPLILVDYFSPEDKEHELLDRKYDFTFEYRNISTFPLPINSIQIAYREFNSSFLDHPDPNLVGIWFLRDSSAHPEKDTATDNCTTWRVNAFPGIKYNEWNVCTTYATNNPPIYVHYTYIAYEVILFSQLIIETITNNPYLNFSTLGYPRNSNESEGSHINDYKVPDTWILSVTITFENASSIDINTHRDGWLEYIKYEPMEWTPYGEGFTIHSSGESRYMEYNGKLNTFHQAVSTYAKAHIHHLLENTSLNN
jgi:hypothetical protein